MPDPAPYVWRCQLRSDPFPALSSDMISTLIVLTGLRCFVHYYIIPTWAAYPHELKSHQVGYLVYNWFLRACWPPPCGWQSNAKVKSSLTLPTLIVQIPVGLRRVKMVSSIWLVASKFIWEFLCSFYMENCSPFSELFNSYFCYGSFTAAGY